MADNSRSDEKHSAGTQAEQPATKAAQQTTQAAREVTRKGAEQAERIVNTAADVNSQTARVGAEIVQRNTQTLHRAVRSGTEMAASLTERSVQQWNRALGLSGNEAEKAVEKSSENIGAILQSSLAFADTTQRLMHEWFNFARERAEQNFNRIDHLFHCRTPQEFVAIQSEVLKDNLEESLKWTRRMAEQSIPMADEAMKKYRANMERAVNVAAE
jgi:hypothetical protein